ncbi:superinfection immunity protein [Streptomyces sp. NBC_01104]|uniref:superinfection immunity protein n=1 Tax=Streptomyces sp. NBC_01104 TaxID=2903750 RepID=UPI00386F6F94|nr:superinfection immunity protein [Streptomyces sp. NBC_01104]
MAYFVPVFVAFSRGVPNKGSVFVVNLFLGWTVVGWIVALAMAARSNQQQQPRL